MLTLKKFLCVFACMAAYTSSAGIYALHATNAAMVVQQERTIKGTVTDEFGPVAGASVAVKGVALGTMTDLNGEFTINVQKGQTLIVSFIGYSPQEILIDNQTVIEVRMSEDTQTLDEVVVTALGIKRSQKALGYSMTEMKGDELNSNLVNPVSALQGKVAGLEIAGSDGGLFGSSKVQIRGASTLGKNNQPIYVVDGVILSNDIKEGNPDWSGNPDDFGNELKNLNPADFETVSVLKGAAATALYGSRGLNGAIVITTKSGKSGQGLGIQVTQTIGIDKLTSAPRLQNDFGPSYIAGYVNYGEKDAAGNYYTFDTYGQFGYNSEGYASLLSQDQGFQFGPRFDGREIEYYDGTYRAYKAKKNNFKEAYNTGFNSTTNVAINGGNERTTFYTSLSYKYAEGTLPNNEFQRFSILGKASHKITDKIKIDFSMSFANSMPKNPQINIGENFTNGNWGRMYDPKHGKSRYKGNHGGMASSTYGDQYANMPGMSTWWRIYENTYKQKETSVRPVFKLEIDLLDWLKFNTEGSYNYYYTRYEAKELGQGFANTGEDDTSGGKYTLSLTTKEQTNFNVNFVVNKTFGDWNVNGFLRGEYYENFMQTQSMNTNGGLIIPAQFFIDNSRQTPKYSAKISDRKKMLSAAYQIGGSWKDQIFLDVTGRNDWSSSLVYKDGHGKYAYFYPSVNASWLVTNTFREKFPEWISFGKIRASWAQVGSDTEPYTINSNYTLSTFTGVSSNYYGLEISSTMPSQNLKPERKTAWEVGLDWRFLSNRFGVDLTYYKENTRNQIMTISVPYQSGIKSQLINAGNIQNTGVELAINTIPIKAKNFEWELNFTYTKNKNKVISLHKNVADYIVLAGDVAYGNFRVGSVAKVGSAYGTLMTDSSVKYDEESGLPIIGWLDSSRTGYLSRDMANVKEIGSITPDFLGGVASRFTYKNWSLSVALDMRFGGYIASYNARYGTAYGYTKQSRNGAPGFGGITWTSAFDQKTYNDGVIPNGIIATGTTITQPNNNVYTVGVGSVSSAGETYQELMQKGVIEPTHSSGWNYRNNQWTNAAYDRGVVNDAWFKKLNYIALRNVSLNYRVPTLFCNKMKAKNMNLTLTGYNLGYLLNSMPNKENPESVAGTAAGEFRVRSFQGVTSSFTFTINVGF